MFVLPSSAADASEETIERIVHQIVTNDQKQDLTDAQRARGIQQMIDAGLSVTKVAKIIRPNGYAIWERMRWAVLGQLRLGQYILVPPWKVFLLRSQHRHLVALSSP